VLPSAMSRPKCRRHRASIRHRGRGADEPRPAPPQRADERVTAYDASSPKAHPMDVPAKCERPDDPARTQSGQFGLCLNSWLPSGMPVYV
jgi:hypothetical protein